jgi:hypothetical protein
MKKTILIAFRVMDNLDHIISASKKFVKAVCQKTPDNGVWKVDAHLGQCPSSDHLESLAASGQKTLPAASLPPLLFCLAQMD